IGSETYMAVKMGRKAVGCELKESYYRQAVANTKAALNTKQLDMFDIMGNDAQNNSANGDETEWKSMKSSDGSKKKPDTPYTS
ncbi:MAG: hypothetical protein J6A79_14870, partial [Clostridia bacterium]|nr:hypothetical protein [Clostridia bacterium]